MENLLIVRVVQVLQMKPWHRTWAVRRLSNRIVSAIERASATNRAHRGLVVDLDAYADLPLERTSFTKRWWCTSFMNGFEFHRLMNEERREQFCLLPGCKLDARELYTAANFLQSLRLSSIIGQPSSMRGAVFLIPSWAFLQQFFQWFSRWGRNFWCFRMMLSNFLLAISVWHVLVTGSYLALSIDVTV